MRNHYAHPADVIRKYNPQLTVQNLRDDGLIGNDDYEQVLSRIEAVESEFDSLTRRPMREVRVGSPGRPETWEHHEADYYRNQRGVKVWLDHQDIAPLDPARGDAVEIQVGRDNWRDITAHDDRWEVDYEAGWLRVFSRLTNPARLRRLRDRFLRITYRHGAPGSSPNVAGQTATTAPVADGDSAVDVMDASMVRHAGVVLLGGDEYASVVEADHESDTLELARGVRGTSPAAHDAGAAVHYCPLAVRDAVAGRAAQEVLRYEDWVDDLIESGGYSVRDKMDDWQQTWERTLEKFSGVTAV